MECESKKNSSKKICCFLLLTLIFLCISFQTFLFNSSLDSFQDSAIKSYESALFQSQNKFRLTRFFRLRNKKEQSEQSVNVTLGGDVFTFELKCSGAIVKEFEDVKTLNGFSCPLKESGIKIGDIITKVNGQEICGAADLVSKIENSDGAVSLNYLRDGKEKQTSVFPQLNISGKKKIGIWIKDDVSATGTLSFVCENTNKFYALGHNIFDYETGAKIPFCSGVVKNCRVVGTEKSKNGKVGEIKTNYDFNLVGSCQINKSYGVCGTLSEKIDGKILPFASLEEVQIGSAQIFCNVTGLGPQAYSCEVIKVEKNKNEKNLTIRITDKKLLEIAGGIVQGMSGSPIVQNEKIIGVLTHSFVSTPSLGFAVLPSKII